MAPPSPKGLHLFPAGVRVCVLLSGVPGEGRRHAVLTSPGTGSHNPYLPYRDLGQLLATKQLKHLIACELAAGHSIAELAKRHNYQYRSMYRLAHSKDVQEQIESEKQLILGAAERTMFRFMLAADALAQHMVEDAMDRASPRQMEARKYILDRVVPTRSTQTAGVNMNLHITKEVMGSLAEALDGLKAQRPVLIDIEASPNLVEGKNAFPEEDVNLGEGEDE